MRDQKSQAGSEEKIKREKVKGKKGHMALRNNVYDLKLELWHILKPLEYYMVDIIIDKTIKWREKEAKITIQEFMERTRQADTHIYAALRSLKAKKVILWRRERHHSIYALNEDFFGGLLIKRHEDALQIRRSKIKVVVDNSKSSVETTDGDRQSDRRDPSVGVTNPVSTSGESRQSEQTQNFEMIEENRSLNTLLKDISLKTSLQSGENGKSGGDLQSLSGGRGTRKSQQLSDPQAEMQRQLRMLREQEEREMKAV